jgi:hypothetical protein
MGSLKKLKPQAESLEAFLFLKWCGDTPQVFGRIKMDIKCQAFGVYTMISKRV